MRRENKSVRTQKHQKSFDIGPGAAIPEGVSFAIFVVVALIRTGAPVP